MDQVRVQHLSFGIDPPSLIEDLRFSIGQRVLFPTDSRGQPVAISSRGKKGLNTLRIARPSEARWSRMT